MIDVIFTLINGQRETEQFQNMEAWAEYMKTITKEDYSRIDVMEVFNASSDNN